MSVLPRLGQAILSAPPTFPGCAHLRQGKASGAGGPMPSSYLYLLVCPPVHLSTCLSVHLLTCLRVYLSIQPGGPPHHARGAVSLLAVQHDRMALARSSPCAPPPPQKPTRAQGYPLGSRVRPRHLDGEQRLRRCAGARPKVAYSTAFDQPGGRSSLSHSACSRRCPPMGRSMPRCSRAP